MKHDGVGAMEETGLFITHINRQHTTHAHVHIGNRCLHVQNRKSIVESALNKENNFKQT